MAVVVAVAAVVSTKQGIMPPAKDNGGARHPVIISHILRANAFVSDKSCKYSKIS